MKNELEINKARAIYYNLFANFFVYTHESKQYFELLKLIEIIKSAPLDEESNKAINDIANKLENDSNIKLMQEYDNIFHNPKSKNVRTTASYYDENLESGKKRVEMLQFLAKTKIRRDEKRYHEYEDSVGFIFALLSELLELVIKGENEYKNTIHCIFQQILNEFIDEFAKEIYEHSDADIYKNLIVVLHSFIEFERLYLEVSKPALKVKTEKDKYEHISDEEKERRERNKALKALGPKDEIELCSLDIVGEVESEI